MSIFQPTFVLDEFVCKSNIQSMAQKARDHGLQFWPHFKTHASAHIAKWFEAEGVEKATVSSIKMAQYFAENGWKHLHIAFPFVINAIQEFKTLSEKCELTVNVVNGAQVDALASLGTPVGLFIEIDAGYGRVGLDSESTRAIQELVTDIERHGNLKLEGFYVHNGQNYNAASINEIKSNHEQALAQLTKLKAMFGQDLRAVLGDTLGCSLASNFSGLDIITPGNFAFYDLMQSEMGVCTLSQIAVHMHCPVVAIKAEEQRIVIHGGAVHFSKDFLIINGQTCYGKAKAVLKPDGSLLKIDSANLISLSQEHGIVHCENKELEQIQIGDVLEIIPVHSCLTAQCIKTFTLKNGETFQAMF